MRMPSWFEGLLQVKLYHTIMLISSPTTGSRIDTSMHARKITAVVRSTALLVVLTKTWVRLKPIHRDQISHLITPTKWSAFDCPWIYLSLSLFLSMCVFLPSNNLFYIALSQAVDVATTHLAKSFVPGGTMTTTVTTNQLNIIRLRR
jgi:hypothetical protein